MENSTSRGAGVSRAKSRLGTAWRVLQDDLRRWPFELVVNVILSSPLVPNPIRALAFRALGMEVESFGVFPRCTFRTTKLRLGRGAVINFGCQFDNNAMVDIGENVSIAMGVTFVTTWHHMGPPECRADGCELRPIVVGKGCWIGAGATILPGVTIGDGCVVAAGSVIRADCAPNGLYVGVPAQRVGGDRSTRRTPKETVGSNGGR